MCVLLLVGPLLGPWYDFEGDVPRVAVDGECGREGGGGYAVEASGARRFDEEGAELLWW